MSKSVSAKSVKGEKVAAKSKNPYRVGSSYWTVVEILAKHKGKMIRADVLVKAFPVVMGAELFKAFKNKDARNEATAKDVEGKVITNAIVITRPDYGAPLRAVGLEVRKERDEQGYRFGLFRCAVTKDPVKPQAKAKANGKAKVSPMATKAASVPTSGKGSRPGTSKAVKEQVQKANAPKAAK